jgi:hypothetical protein
VLSAIKLLVATHRGFYALVNSESIPLAIELMLCPTRLYPAHAITPMAAMINAYSVIVWADVRRIVNSRTLTYIFVIDHILFSLYLKLPLLTPYKATLSAFCCLEVVINQFLALIF